MENKALYNGKTVEQIENNLPANMISEHCKHYLNNVREVIQCQLTGINTQEIEIRKNANFNLINFYLTH